jgi:hypothetical protein
MKLQGFAVAGKSWVGLIGSFLTFLVPWVVQESNHLPAPWPIVIGAAVAIATAVGVYHAPYQPVQQQGKHEPQAGSPWPQ